MYVEIFLSILLQVSALKEFSPKQVVQQVVMDIPTRITLRVGETDTLRLPGLGSAGYIWTHEVVGNEDVVDVSTTTAESLQIDDAREPTTVGSSRDELFIIRAVRAGQSTIRFSQKRSWEGDQPPLKEHILEVDVNN